MKRLKSDISHRIRRRQPSIFAAAWFRLLLAGGVAVVLGLLVGPSLAAWLAGDLPPALRRVAPWHGLTGARPEAPAVATVGPAPASTTAATEVARQPPAPAAPAPPGPAPGEGAAPAPPTGPGRGPVAAAPPGALFRVQLGAFLERRNAERLVARLEEAGLGGETVVREEDRPRFRVVVPPAASAELHDEALDDAELAGRLRGLGLEPAPVAEGHAVTGAMPLRSATDVAHRLRDEGLPVRVLPVPEASTLRVVRVGAYGSHAEAEQARAVLAGRGFEGAVVRER
jgi:cell division septation protein DedD